jgi:hypothetical protein
LVQVVVKKPLSLAVSRVGVMAPREESAPSGGNALSAHDRNDLSPVRSGRLGRRRPAGQATSSPASPRRVLDRSRVSPRCRRQLSLTGDPRAPARHRRTLSQRGRSTRRTSKPGASAGVVGNGGHIPHSMTTPPDGTGPVGDVGAAAFPGLPNRTYDERGAQKRAVASVEASAAPRVITTAPRPEHRTSRSRSAP